MISCIIFPPTAIALGSSAIVKVSGQNSFRTLYGSPGQIRLGLPKGSAEISTKVPTKLLQVSWCLWFFGADPSWAAKRFRGRFHQGSAEGSAKVSPRFHQGFTKVSPRFHQASPSFAVPLGQICLGLPKRSFLGCQKVLWRVHLGFTEVPPRFHRGSTKVPPRFHQGCTKVSPRFHAVEWSLVEFHLKINRCCWGYSLGLCIFCWVQ